MPYRVRAFCTGCEVPTLIQGFEYAKSKGVSLSADERHGSTDIDSTDWTVEELAYKPGKGPIVVECSRDDGKEDCLARVEPEEFIELIGRPGLSLTKRVGESYHSHPQFPVIIMLLSPETRFRKLKQK